MASGGWLSNILSAPLKLVGNLFNSGNSTYTASQPSVTAADLVPKTEAQEPEAPVLGDTTNYTKKKRGLSSLYINNNNNSADYTGRSGL